MSARTSTGRATGLMVVATLVIAWLAIVFSNNDQAVRIGDGSEALLRTEELLNAVVAARATFDVAMVFATAEESELAEREATDAIVAEGQNLVARIESSLAQLGAVDPTLDPTVITATGALVSTAIETLDLVDAAPGRRGRASCPNLPDRGL